MLCEGVKRRLRPAFQHIAAGGIDVGKIGADRAALVVVQPFGGGEDVEDGRQRPQEQRDLYPRALRRQPFPAAQCLDESAHMAGLTASD